jgi:PAS domain S-box-containing protein
MSNLPLYPNLAETLIQSLPEGIVTINESGQIMSFNRSAERIIGWSNGEALGKSINEVLPLAAGKGQFLERLSAAAIPPINAMNRQGRDITLAVTTASLDLPEGFAPQTVLVIRDVTTEDAAQRLRSYFLANISHEFRTPLSALKASVELLLEGVDSFTLNETLELARSIHFSVTSLQTLVDNLLESVSIEAGRFRIRRRSTDIGLLVAEVAALMKPLLERRGQKLITSLPDHLPQLSVDPMRLTQVLVNLLSNASKYGPMEEPIELALCLQQDQVLKLSVSDRGSGIPAEDKENIFRRFVRLEEKDNTQYGVGLGLSVVKTIVESHGGTVGMEERPGGGSIFWFTIPLKEA